MEKEMDRKARGLIFLALLVLVCIGVIVFCVLYITNADTGLTKLVHINTSQDNFDNSVTSYHNQSSEDVEDDKDEAPTTPTTTAAYTILLNKEANSPSGIVYIQTDDRKGFVCTDGYDISAATVTCRELGFEHGVPYNNSIGHYPYTHYTLDEPILSQVNCTGSEQKLSECAGFRLDNETACTWFTGVVCYNGETPYELRLVNGTNPDSGLVEMKVGGEWGILCAIRQFNDEVADILCRNMNYTGGISVIPADFGTVTTGTKLWLPYIYCGEGSGVKQTIFECFMTLHPGNVLYDYVDFRANRGIVEFMACYGEHSGAAAVQCLK